MNDVYLYPYSAEEARRRDELSLWRASHRENIACKEAIEEAVRQHFDGSRLDNDCLTEVFQEFGYKRTAWVLANTLQQLEWDGRFSPKNKAWAEQFSIPWDKQHGPEFVVTSHPAVLDGVVDQYRKIYQELGLFGPEQCEPNSYSSLDYEGKVLVLSPDILKESYPDGGHYQLQGRVPGHRQTGFPHWRTPGGGHVQSNDQHRRVCARRKRLHFQQRYLQD